MRHSLSVMPLLALASLVTTACAGVSSQYFGRPIDAEGVASADRVTSSGLVISGEELGDYSSETLVLLNTRERDTPCIDSMLIDYELEHGEHERVWLRFRQPLDRSEWQHDTCAPPFNGFRRSR